MNHNRYLITNRTVCQDPDKLGSDFIITDTSDEDDAMCLYCYTLIFTYNEREHQRELMEAENRYYNTRAPKVFTKVVGPASIGLLSMFLAAILFIIWMVAIR